MKKLSILVVEDNASYLEIAKKVFEGIENLEVDSATNRNDALLKLKSKKYDAVITDRNMPSFEGESLQLELLPKEVQNVDPYREEIEGEIKKSIILARNYDGLQGDIVALTSALVHGITTLVHSWHGDSSSFSFYYLRSGKYGVNKEEVIDILKKYSVTFEEYVQNSFFKEESLADVLYNNNWYCSSIKSPARIDSENRYVRKTDPESWAHAIHLLKKWEDW